jgi:CheY-like chemotaxis protein
VLARLSSGLAHEIKNPLAIIHARASDLADLIADGEIPSSTQVAKTCASIVQTSDRAIRILRGVAAMARVATHDPMLPADVNAIIEQAVDLVRGRYKTHGVVLETNVPSGLPMVDCREVQISQILVNLLNNAFDAVDGDKRSERWVRVNASTQSGAQQESHAGRLLIDVIDGGPGVAPEHRDRLMQSFFTTKSMGAGTGIGLSVSRSIADDELELLEIFSAWLGRSGCRVRTAPNGAEALKILLSEKIDVLLSDIRMPVMDGVTLVRRIDELGLSIPSIMFVSGYGDVMPREMYALGVERLMEKPLSRKDLLRAMDESLMDREDLWLTPSDQPMDQSLGGRHGDMYVPAWPWRMLSLNRSRAGREVHRSLHPLCTGWAVPQGPG